MSPYRIPRRAGLRVSSLAPLFAGRRPPGVSPESDSDTEFLVRSGDYGMAWPVMPPSRSLLAIIGLDVAGLLAIKWLSTADVNSILSTLTMLCLGGATVYITVRERIDRQATAARRRRFEEQLWEQRERDKANAESLTARLDAMTKKLEESESNQVKMRESLHALRDEANQYKIDADNLRQELREMTGQLRAVTDAFHESSHQLHEADTKLHTAEARIAKLSAQIASYQTQAPGMVEEASERGAEKGAAKAVEKAIGDSQHDLGPVGGAGGGGDYPPFGGPGGS